MTIDQLKENNLLLLECISGSKAYGLDTEKSDTDLKGVFYLPKNKFYGLEYVAQVSNETNDEVYYELGRFVELLLRNNPNILELLATPADCILFRHAVMDRLDLSMFMSKLCKETFAGYAVTQIKKARGYKKKIVNPVEKDRKTVLDFCFILQGYSSVPVSTWLADNKFLQEHCGLVSIPHSKNLYALFYDAEYRGIISSELANDVSLSSIPKGRQPLAHMYFNKEGYSTYCKEYKEYWEWVDKRNDDRYQGNIDHGKGYDSKNMMHTIRLLQVAEEILRTGQLNVKRTNRDELLDIKTGKYPYDHLLEMANGLMQKIEIAYEASKLPQAPDSEKIEAVLIEMRELLYR